ncbi:phage holin family protein [Carnobacterium gallinarum]|uniref:phage holin family protein n=1 Tax=Carnobacterium gallinarum TaxID=2749 RepID=UPI0005564589|nr:phage holin family protein [Carnobacterium gallinarum]
MDLINLIFHTIFGGGSTVLSLYMTALIIDVITGYMKSLKSHDWRSSISIEGLLMKFATFFTIIAADIIDQLAPLMNITIPINVAFWWTIMITLYELGSILENISQMGVNIGFLKNYLGVLNKQADINGKEKKK